MIGNHARLDREPHPATMITSLTPVGYEHRMTRSDDTLAIQRLDDLRQMTGRGPVFPVWQP